MTANEDLQQRISLGFAPLVALYQVLDARRLEPGRTGPDLDWTARLNALRVLREGAVPGDWAALAGALLSPEERDVRQVAVVTDPGRLGGLVSEAVRLGERVLLFADADRVPDDVLAVDGELAPAGARWGEELRILRRDLLIIEQWPRDQATLASAREDEARLEVDAAATRERLDAELAGARVAAEAAERAAAEAVEAELRAIEGEKEALATALECRMVFTEAQEIADAAARQADGAARTAAASAARCGQIEQRIARARAEVANTRQIQSDLAERLERARVELPAATAEAERLAEAAVEAEALSHATYYRLASAESSLAAERKRQNWGQRLHVSPARPELAEQRASVHSRRLEAEQALARAQEISEARQRAEGERAGMAAFLENGGQELEEAKAAQRRLVEEIPRLEGELAQARADHESHAAVAAETAAQAARAAQPAAEARTRGLAAEERLRAAGAMLVEAQSARLRAKHAEQEAVRAVADAEAAVERYATQTAKAAAEAKQETELAEAVVARSSEQVSKILADEDEGTWRERAVIRVEQLTAEPLSLATVVCTGPDAIPAGDYDVLIVDRAEQCTDGDFLLGALRTRRQVLVGTPGAAGPVPDPSIHDLLAALDALAQAGTGGATQPVGLETYGPSVKAEIERLRASGLWDTLYAELYGKITRRLGGLGLDPAEALATVLAERLETGLYQRCLATSTPGK